MVPRQVPAMHPQPATLLWLNLAGGLAMLGRRLKYSRALFDDAVRDLDMAEERMLALTCERAALRGGQRVLDLGCGWGSLSLWLAERYSTARILAVSNSKLQREFIEERARWGGSQ